VAQESGIDPQTAAALLAADRQVLSLSEPVRDGHIELGELLPSDDEGPDSLATAHAFDASLHDLVGQLPPAEKEVLTVRFGLDGSDPGTLSDAAEHLGVSRQRARQIERRALRRLRGPAVLGRITGQVA
jgi:RNA polymerase sigma factor (sigma-70 family)